ncbi:MAG: peptidase C39 family protein [Chloroflexi bacterium]|nr:peptidase C39 family protein [Chloroflexota bacterium]
MRYWRVVAVVVVVLSLGVGLLETEPVLAADNSRGSELWLSSNAQDFAGWRFEGLKPGGDGLKLDAAALKSANDPYGAGGYNGGNYYNGGHYFYGEAVAPFHAPVGGFDNAVVSWNAETPAGTWVALKLRALIGNHWTREYVLGVWASEEGTVKRHSVDGQTDGDGKVQTDTLVLNNRASAFQLRVVLFSTNQQASPYLRATAVSAVRNGAMPAVTSPRLWNHDLSVPERSQMIYPDGGEVWCSPTSVSMVLEYWSHQTGQANLNQTVPFTAAHTNDWIYQGNGNWPFNTAYAASFGLTAYVSRFHSLSQVEPWIERGIPVIVSVAYRPGELAGTPISQTDGHLIVLRGFDSSGNVIVNDPAGDPRIGQKVRIVYNRAQFEKVWQNGSGGAVYLIYPQNQAIPTQNMALTAWPSTTNPAFADPVISTIWQGNDASVLSGASSRTWTWGPQPNTSARLEPYTEGPDGWRLVQYFDKSRMEVTRPEGDRSSKWFVTNGLLTVELVLGRIQTGDSSYQTTNPAQVPVAGDPNSPQAPTYATFNSLASLPGTSDSRRVADRKGQAITATLDRSGQSGQFQPATPVKAAYYDSALGHNIPDVFWNWLNDSKNGLDWLFALGHPISEPYWVTVNLQGRPTQVLVQLFERRVLTYNPANSLQWRVEMGNIGQHYFRWRYPNG